MTKRERERGRDRKSRYNCGNSIELDLFFEFKGASNRAIKKMIAFWPRKAIQINMHRKILYMEYSSHCHYIWIFKLVDAIIKAKRFYSSKIEDHIAALPTNWASRVMILLPCRTHTIISGRQFPLASGKFTWQWPIKKRWPRNEPRELSSRRTA